MSKITDLIFYYCLTTAFTLNVFTSNPHNRTVECTQFPGDSVTFECEFCYGPNTCQNLTACITIGSSATATMLQDLVEEVYCYRATARVNGNIVAVIQDTFRTGKLCNIMGHNLCMVVVVVVY